MPHNLFKLLSRAGVYCEPTDGNGNDLGGGAADDQGGSDADKGADTDKGTKIEGADNDGKLKDDKPADNDSGNKPSDAEAKLLKELMGLKDKHKTTDAELKQVKAALGDVSLDDLKTIIQERKDAERVALEKRGEYDRILEQVKQEHSNALSGLQAEVDALKAQLGQKDESLVELTVGRAFSESAFIREESRIPASIARKEFGSHVEIVDGATVVYDKPRGAAERTPIVGGDGKPKSFEEAIKVLYANHPESADLIRAKVKPGSGSNTTDLGGKKPDDKSKEIQPGTSRIAQALAAAKKP